MNCQFDSGTAELGPPAEGPGGPPAPPWATATAAVGPGGKAGEIDWNEDTAGYYTKPWKIMQSPRNLYKDMKFYTKTQNTKQ